MDLYQALRPLIWKLDAERAHHLALWGLGNRFVSGAPYADPILETTVFGRQFVNPIGLAAGFDKEAQIPMQALALGFGFVEIGSVTPEPQPGNPKPRLFRLEEDRAVINRMGFNSGGADNAARNLERLLPPPRINPIGVNLGKNKTTEDAAADYETGIAKLARFADYLVVNVSSPNTPGLRALQSKADLTALIVRVKAALLEACPAGVPPLLVKVAPDLTEEDIADISAVAVEQILDGLICTNTTIARPMGLQSRLKSETGGLSGKPLFRPSTDILRAFRRATKGKVPLIGVGGVMSGADAYEKIRAGASLVQVYSGMVYEGPSLPGRACRTLAGLLKRDGFAGVADAVGVDVD